MHTYDYELVTDTYSASGQVDAESEEAAKLIIRRQVAHPRKQALAPVNDENRVPEIKKLKVTLTTPA
jgi:hypothetical protein